jgi:phage major head subunit gpT-like protein
MPINEQTLDPVFKGFKAIYTDAAMEAPAHADKIVMAVPSGGRDETYSWLGTMPALREWIGPRVIRNLKAQGFTIANRTFESTVRVRRDDISDDKIADFKPFFAEMGQATRRHKEELVFGLLRRGFDTDGFDGQRFLDTDHPVELDDGSTATVANTDGGSGPAWFLLDTSRAIRPIIWQEREAYEFQAVNRHDDAIVRMTDEYLYGVRARVNAGFGLWQLAWGSRQALTDSSYAAARAAMMGFRGDGGKLPGVTPTVLAVPPALESAALHIRNTDLKAGGESNPWTDRRAAPMQASSSCLAWPDHGRCPQPRAGPLRHAPAAGRSAGLGASSAAPRHDHRPRRPRVQPCEPGRGHGGDDRTRPRPRG